MSLSSQRAQISSIEKEILDLEKKILREQKKVLGIQSQIDGVNRTINKNTSIISLKNKQSQILRFNTNIVILQKKINDYEKQKRAKKDNLLKKNEDLRKAELAEQKKQLLSSKRQITVSMIYNKNNLKNISSSFIESENSGFNTMETINELNASKLGNDGVFISYSWDSPEHEDMIIDFTNHLRSKGFEAVIDKMLSQEETAINFVKMMFKAMTDYSKVIVVLSKGYKIKADGFNGGVGREYELLINDIIDHPNKYILASFEGRGDDITPAGLKGRDIIDLSNPAEETRLFEKILGHKRYVFAEVAPEKPVLPIHTIGRSFVKSVQSIIIDEPIIKATGDAGLQEGKYKFIDFFLTLSITNNSDSVINGFACSLRFRRELDLENYYNAHDDGYITHQMSNEKKLYPKQSWSSEQVRVKISRHNIQQIIGSTIIIKVFTEQGFFERLFVAEDLIRIKPGGEHYRDAIPLSLDLFN